MPTRKKTAKKTKTTRAPRKTTAKRQTTTNKKTNKKAASKKTASKKASKKVGKKTGKKTAGKKRLKKGDKVSWSSLNGPSQGTVKKKITRKTKIKSHTVEASPEAPQYLVASSKTGKKAAHKAKSLRKQK